MQKFTLTLAISCILGSAIAANGDLDTSFDSDGLAITDFAGNTDNGRIPLVQSDGKLILAGFDSGAQNCTVARYNANGSLDTSFDTDGKASVDFGSNEQCHAAALDSSGKIVLGGLGNASGNFDFIVARFNTDGSLDTTFDSDGMVTVDIGSMTGDQSFGIAVQSDDKIVVAGFSGSPADFAVIRLNTNGSLDTTFDTDGKQTIDFGGNDQGKAVAIQADGKIVVAGFASAADFAVARLNANGSLDTTFDTDGMVITDIAGGNDQGRAMALQSDGKIVVAGISPGSDFALVRYNTNGSLDTSFDTDGKVVTDFNSSNDQANGIFMQSDDKAVVIGLTDADGDFNYGVARYNTDGSLDTTFSGDGLLTVDFGSSGNDQGYGITRQDDGYLVLGGLANAADFGIARIEGDDMVPVELSFFEIE